MSYTYAAYYHHQFDHRQPQFHPYQQPPSYQPPLPPDGQPPYAGFDSSRQQQSDYVEWQHPPTHNTYVAACQWQQDCISFYQSDRYPPRPDPDPPDSPPASAHHTRQGDFQQPPNYPNGPGPEPYAQPRYFTAGYHPWQTDAQADYPTEAILDHLLAALAIFETRLDTMDRRLDNLRPPAQPEPGPPYGLHNYGLTELGLLRTAATNTLGPQPYPGYPARQPDNQHQRTVFPATELSALQTQPPQHACGQHHHQHQQPALDQQPPPQRSPSNHLHQAVSCLEQPATVQQPLPQHPPSVWHPTSLDSATLLIHRVLQRHL